MRYERMLPWQIRRAIEEHWPVVLPLGVLEYHGEHMAVGMDTLAVVRIMDIIEQEMPVVLLPPFYYGAASYVVEKPEGKGSVHVDAEALLPFAKQMFGGLLRVGFRNIHCFIHHQTENFAAGMPTDLAFKLAARQAIFAFAETTLGEAWWGNAARADYYSEQAAGADPINWIGVHPLQPIGTTHDIPFDHAGLGETSLLLALDPDAVDMTKFSAAEWYVRDAGEASAEFGGKGRDIILEHVRKVLRRA